MEKKDYKRIIKTVSLFTVSKININDIYLGADL